ncbi:MAG: hypothetical protein FWD58_07015 [Firmicutes bacterium]|nr:hypothetical protein [Bacillota bacterium]
MSTPIKEHINHTRLPFSCGAGEASVSVRSGHLIFACPDISVGAGNFAMDIAHVYNAELNAFDVGMGNGWKLNAQQYIIPAVGNNGSDTDTFTYIDAMGYSHEFVYYVGSGVRYFYDKSGLNLTMEVSGSGSSRYYAIADDVGSGNEMIFDSDGRITGTVSALNNAIEKCYVYNPEGRLAEIYDARKSTRKLLLNYYLDGRLSSIEYEPDTNIYPRAVQQTIYYDYDLSGNLIRITRSAGPESETVAYFEYLGPVLAGGTCALTKAVSGVDSSALGFQYDSSKRIWMVRSGFCGVRVTQRDPNVYAEVPAGLYAGTVRCGDAGVFCCSAEPLQISFGNPDPFCAPELNVPDWKAWTELDIVTSKKRTIVSSEKKTALKYYFDNHGFTVSVFEQDGLLNLKTLAKDTGVPIASASGNGYSETINGSRTMYSSGNFDRIALENLPASLSSPQETHLKRYVFTAWIKIRSEGMLRARLELSYKNQAQVPKSFFADINPHAVEVWQFVSIPLTLDQSNNKKGTEVELCLLNGRLNHCRFYAANCRIASAPHSTLQLSVPAAPPALEDCIEDVLKSSHVMLTRWNQYSPTHISLPGGTYTESENFLTAEDIIRTILNKKLRSDGNGAFDFVYSGGTKRISDVTAAALGNYSHAIDIALVASGGASLYTKTVSPDEKTVTQTEYIFEDDQFDVSNNLIEAGGIKAVTTTTLPDVLDSFGVPVSTSTVTKTSYAGLLLYTIDAYGIKTKQVYDAYGNVEAVEQSDAFGSLPTLYYVMHFNSNPSTPESSREFVTQESSLSGLKIYTYKDPYALESVTKNNGKIEYDYNSFYDRIEELKTKKAANYVNAGNTLTYENGRIRTASDAKSTFGAKFHPVGSGVEFTVFDDSVEKVLQLNSQEFNNGSGTTTLTSRYFRSPDGKSDTVHTQLDPYGRVKNVTYEVTSDQDPPIVKHETSFEYMGDFPSYADKESAYVQPIKSIFDGNTGYHTYQYKDGRLNGFSHGTFAMEQESGAATKFWYSGLERYANGFFYDEEKTIASRLKESNTYKLIAGQYTETPLMGKSYTYDCFGNIKISEHSRSEALAGHTHLKEYKTTTDYNPNNGQEILGIAFSADYKVDSVVQASTHVKYSYASILGEIVAFTETFGATMGGVSNLQHLNSVADKVSVSYNIDELGRIKRETNSAFGIDWMYAYDGNRLKSRYETENPDYGYRIDHDEDLEKEWISVKQSNNEEWSKQVDLDLYGNFEDEDDIRYAWQRGNWLAGVGLTDGSGGISSWNAQYTYNYQGVREFKNKGQADQTEYLWDGGKLMGENRGYYAEKKLRYFYDASGICGLHYDSGQTHGEYNIGKHFVYVKDGFGNVTAIVDEKGLPVARYHYDALGECKITAFDFDTPTSTSYRVTVCERDMRNGELKYTIEEYVSGVFQRKTVYGHDYNGAPSVLVTDEYELTLDPDIYAYPIEEVLCQIAFVNPIRWKSHYCDAETGFYAIYMHGRTRYYYPLFGRFLDADTLELTLSRALKVGGLDRRSLGVLNPLTFPAYGYNIYSNTFDGVGGPVDVSGLGMDGGGAWPSLKLLDDITNVAENGFGSITGAINGLRTHKGLSKISGFEKASNALMWVAAGTQFGISVYDNFIVSNDYSMARKFGNLYGEGQYITLSALTTLGVATALAPTGIGIIAVPIAFGVGIIVDLLWKGEWNLFGIHVPGFKINGKSIDQLIKNFWSWVFGGFK